MWVFCWYATHEAASFRDVADRFNISLSTLHLIIENVTSFLSNKSKTVITWPSEEEKAEIINDFDEMGFPNVLECIDGTSIHQKMTVNHISTEKSTILYMCKQFVILSTKYVMYLLVFRAQSMSPEYFIIPLYLILYQKNAKRNTYWAIVLTLV